MKIVFTYIIIFLLFSTCGINHKTDNTVLFNSKTNISLNKDNIENFENRITNLMQSLKVGENPEDYNNSINKIKDSIEYYKNNLIADLKKKSNKNKQILNLIKTLEQNSNLYIKNLKYESDIVSNSYGNSSYGFVSPRYQYTNGYIVYSLWQHLLFLKSMDQQIRENIIDNQE